MEGTVVRKNHNSCLIRTDDGQEYYWSLTRFRYADQVQEGAKVSFDPSDLEPPPGKPRGAIRVRLLGGAEQGRDFVPRPRHNPDDLLVKIEPALAGSALYVVVRTNRLRITVKLKAGGEPMYPTEGMQTDPDGKAEFAFAHNDLEYIILEAVVDDKIFSRPWFKNPPQPAADMAKQRAEKDVPVHLKVKPNQVVNVMVFPVTSTKGPKADAPLTATKFTIRSENGTEFQVSKVGSTQWQSGSEVELECPGQQSYQFQWKTRIAGEHVYLRADGNPQEFGPYYVTGHCLAPPELGATASPATTTIN